MRTPESEGGIASIAIITISKDDPSGLERTLASIDRQTDPPTELALVRAGQSCDAAVDPSCARHVFEVADPGRGISAAFNAAIEACSAEWVMFLNGGDELLRSDCLARLAHACNASAGMDIVTCRAATDAGTALPRLTPRTPCEFLYVSHQASLFRRKLFSTVGPYSEQFRIRMDLDWMARYLLSHGTGRIAFVDEAVVRYPLDGISSNSLIGFHLEELRVLCRSLRLAPALFGFAVRRVPGRLLRDGWRRMTRWS